MSDVAEAADDRAASGGVGEVEGDVADGRTADRYGLPARDGDDVPAFAGERLQGGFTDEARSSGNQNSWHILHSYADDLS